MKRFWKQAAAVRSEGGWEVELDGRPLRTPARKPLVLPTQALADAVAGEWFSAGEIVDVRSMPLTGLANAATDRVAPDADAFAALLSKYGESDLLLYRAESPPALARQQAEAWDPLLAWARRRFDVDFTVTAGIIYVPQPQATVDRLAYTVAALDPYRLAGLSPLVTIGGSLVAALAVVEQAMTAEAAWEAVSLDERWQLEKWGSDAEGVAALQNRRGEYLAAAKFLELLD